MTHTRIPFAAATLAALLVVAGCSSSGSSAPASTAPAASAPAATAPAASAPAATAPAASAPAAAGKAVITIKDFAYSGTMTVTSGEKVTVVNNDTAAHTVTAKAGNAFDTGNVAAGGGKGSFTAPTKPGSYAFGCTYHPNMAGTLIVK